MNVKEKHSKRKKKDKHDSSGLWTQIQTQNEYTYPTSHKQIKLYMGHLQCSQHNQHAWQGKGKSTFLAHLIQMLLSSVFSFTVKILLERNCTLRLRKQFILSPTKPMFQYFQSHSLSVFNIPSVQGTIKIFLPHSRNMGLLNQYW